MLLMCLIINHLYTIDYPINDENATSEVKDFQRIRLVIEHILFYYAERGELRILILMVALQNTSQFILPSHKRVVR